MSRTTSLPQSADSTVFGEITALPASPVPTMAYVPFQIDKETYDAEIALTQGTLFKVLDKPFCRGWLR